MEIVTTSSRGQLVIPERIRERHKIKEGTRFILIEQGDKIILEKEEEIHKLIIEHDLNKITEKQFLQECSKILGIIIPYPKYKYAYKKNSLNKDLIEIIQKLKDKYKIALLTNNNKEYCQEYLFKPKLDKLFDIMVISYLVGYRKPDSNIYKILIKKLNLKPEEILFVDDDPTKMASAEALGIKTLVYKGKETNKILSNLS